MSAITHMEARRRVLAMVPNCKGWARYEDVAQSGKDPPWIVIKFIENQRLVTESLAVTTKLATLEIRVVGDTADGIGVICDKMCDALQGAWPGPPPDARAAFPCQLGSLLTPHQLFYRPPAHHGRPFRLRRHHA